jgi:hypothetical protein
VPPHPVNISCFIQILGVARQIPRAPELLVYPSVISLLLAKASFSFMLACSVFVEGAGVQLKCMLTIPVLSSK